MFGVKFFDYAKPIKLLYNFIKSNKTAEKIVLDFFSGSATTARAVMQLNAEDGGNRKFIMVQLPEETDEKSEAYKAGYKTICEIGKERIRRAGRKVASDKWLVFSCQGNDRISLVAKKEAAKYGCKELSRSACLAEINGSDEGDLFARQKTSDGGTVCSVGSDASCCSVDSVKHCGGAGEKFDKGVSAVSVNCQREQGGIGNTTSNLRSNRKPCPYGHFGSNEQTSGSGENVECPYKYTQQCPLIGRVVSW